MKQLRNDLNNADYRALYLQKFIWAIRRGDSLSPIKKDAYKIFPRVIVASLIDQARRAA